MIKPKGKENRNMKEAEKLLKEAEGLENEISRLYHERGEGNDNLQWFRENIQPIIRKQEELREKAMGLENLSVGIGEGVTISCWTDCMAYTVIERTAKTITIQRDRAIRTDNYGMSECQEYRYERNPKGSTMTMRWSEKKHCWVNGVYTGSKGRREYYDYSF